MGRILNVPHVATPATLDDIRKTLRAAGNPDDAVHLLRFFKTGPGEYGEGDRFLGIRVPAVREIVREFAQLSHDDTLLLLQSSWHEERLTALLLLDQAHASGDAALRKKIFDAYLANTQFINNWDLVDASAGPIAGPHLNHTKPRTLSRLAHSPMLWERRIAIVSTFYHIKQNEFDATLLVSGWLVNDTHDLIHKAVGWMLREVGKRDASVEEAFLLRHYQIMPRTMLRYAIERFPEKRRNAYPAGVL
ncbi:MAG: DNA alkylation repair protein [Gemmatimonadaceae bacterium]